MLSLPRAQVALIGSGNWGSAIATKLGVNVLKPENGFDPVVEMWVFEEYVKFEGGKWERPARGARPPEGKTWVDEGYSPLTQVINEKHENIIYLPDIPLPVSIHANPDIKSTVTGATMMIFVIPHNFLAPLVPKLEGAFAPGCIGISLIKGIEFKDGTPKTWDVIEAEELNGQKLQGTGTSKDVMECIHKAGKEKDFPLMVQIHKIAFEGAAPDTIIDINK